MVSINIGDPLVKKPKYGIPRRFNLTEEDMAMLRSLNQARKESRKNENKNINDPNNWPADIKPYRGKAAAPPRVEQSPEEKARLIESKREALRAKEEKSVKYYLMSPKDRIQALTARLAEARANAVEEAAACAARKKLKSCEKLEAVTGTDAPLEGGVSALKRPLEDLNCSSCC